MTDRWSVGVAAIWAAMLVGMWTSYADAQPQANFVFPAETEASDAAWEAARDYAACKRDQAECARQEASKPLCESYRQFAWIWFDLRDARNYPAGWDFIKDQSDMIEQLGTPAKSEDPPYYRLPDYKVQLRRIL